MIDDQLGIEILKTLDSVRKKYGKQMKEKDRKTLIDLNKKIYDIVGGIVRDPLTRQDPSKEPRFKELGQGNFGTYPPPSHARPAESVDLQRLAQMVIENISKNPNY